MPACIRTSAAALAGAIALASPSRSQATDPAGYVLEFGAWNGARSSAPELAPGEAMTLEVRVFRTAAGCGGVLMGRTIDPPGTDPWMQYGLTLTPDCRPELVQSTGDAGSLRVAEASAPLPLRSWAHVAGTLDGTTLRLYVDGALVATAVSPGPPIAGPFPFGVGAGWTSAGLTQPALDVALSGARVWARALAADEILASAAGGTPDATGLVADWPLDDGPGVVARDTGPNHVPLQLGSDAAPDWNDPRWIHAGWLGGGPYFALEGPTHGPLCDGPGAACLLGGILVTRGARSVPDAVGATLAPGGGALAPLVALENDGAGHLSDATASIFPGDPQVYMVGIVAADLTGDGLLDLLMNDTGPDLPPYPGAQDRLFVQAADGSFVDETAARLPVEIGFNHTMAVADIDGDGDLDAYAGSISGVYPRIFVNDGTGHFVADRSRLPDDVATQVHGYTASVFADFDGDGDQDLFLGAAQNQHLATDTLLLNDGTGHFTAAPDGALPPRPSGIDGTTGGAVAGDLDGDGLPDLVLLVANSDFSDPRLVLFLNRGGTFEDANSRLPQSWDAFVHSGLGGPILADVNGDGLLDILGQGGSGGTPQRLYLNTGGGFFVDATELLPIRLEPTSFAAGDLDGDGDVDLWATGGTNMYVVRNLVPLIDLPRAALAPEAIDFGAVPVGTAAEASVLVSSTGAAALLVRGQTASPAFTIVDECPRVVATGSSCTVRIAFEPSAVGPWTGALTLVDDAPGSPHVVSLSGSAYLPDLVAGTTSVSFEPRLVGTASASRTISLHNPGAAPFPILAVEASGPFVVDHDCGARLAPGGTCSLNVGFAPASAGVQTGSVTVTAPVGSSPVVVALQGTGTDFAVVRAGTGPLQLSGGGPATAALEVQPVSGFAGTVSLSCAGAPVGTTCTVTPATAEIAGAPAPVTLVLSRGVAAGTVASAPGSPPKAPLAAAAAAVGIAFLRRRRWRGVVLAAVLAAACDRSASRATPPTTKGVVTVTATSGGQSRTLDVEVVIEG